MIRTILDCLEKREQTLQSGVPFCCPRLPTSTDSDGANLPETPLVWPTRKSLVRPPQILCRERASNTEAVESAGAQRFPSKTTLSHLSQSMCRGTSGSSGTVVGEWFPAPIRHRRTEAQREQHARRKAQRHCTRIVFILCTLLRYCIVNPNFPYPLAQSVHQTQPL